MRGRPPIPTALKELRGTARADRINNSEPRPQVLDTLPRPPKQLTRHARHYWRKIGRLLIRMRVLTEADLVALRMLCMYLGQIDEINEIMEQLPPAQRYVLRSGKGGHYQNPLYGTLNTAVKEAHRWMAKFGLTPSDRARVVAMDDKEDIAELFGFMN